MHTTSRQTARGTLRAVSCLVIVACLVAFAGYAAAQTSPPPAVRLQNGYVTQQPGQIARPSILGCAGIDVDGTLNAAMPCGVLGYPLHTVTDSVTSPATGVPDVPVSSRSLSMTAVGNAVVLTVPPGMSTLETLLAGLTASGGTVGFKATPVAGGTFGTFAAQGGSPLGDSTSLATDGTWTIDTAGHVQIELVVLTAGTGTVTVSGNFAASVRLMNARVVTSALPAGAATAALQPTLNGDGGALAHITNLPATQPVTDTATASLQASNAGAGVRVQGTIADSNSAAFQGEVAMVVGTTYAAARSVKAICTAAGNVALTYANGSTGVWQAGVGMNTFPVAATQINTSGTTATCTYGNLL